MFIEAAHAAETVANEAAAQPDLLGSLGIQWRLFVAQLVNFGIVLFVLWKWVFTPAMTALENRQKTIEKGLQDAEASSKALASASEEKESTIVSARQEAAKLVEGATLASEKIRKETLEKTKAEVAELVAQGKAKLAEEKDKIVIDAKSEIAGLVVSATEKVLDETIDGKKHKGLIEAAVSKLIG